MLRYKPPSQIGSYALSRDNRRLYYTSASNEADIWLAFLYGKVSAICKKELSRNRSSPLKPHVSSVNLFFHPRELRVSIRSPTYLHRLKGPKLAAANRTCWLS